jgi:hypothetical protein
VIATVRDCAAYIGSTARRSVRVNGRPATASTPVKPGDRVEWVDGYAHEFTVGGGR